MAIDTALKDDLRKYLEQKITESRRQAYIISAFKMDREELQNVVDAFPFLKKYQFVNVVNSDILGGFIIKYESRIIDFSVAAQLTKFKKIIYEAD